MFRDAATISALERHGFLSVRKAGGELLFLTPKGLAARNGHNGWAHAVEDGWSGRSGPETMAGLRRVLLEDAGSGFAGE
jgi:hypothetical protein